MFGIRQSGSTIGREITGGVTTFMAMSYILFVQPIILAGAGMDTAGVFIATCIASAVGCFLMGLLANYPVALAPGMGQNVFFVYSIVLAGSAFGLTWRGGLAIIFLSGAIFLLLAVFGLRSRVLNALPDALKSGIASGIGLLITLIGLGPAFGHLVVPAQGVPIGLADMQNNPAGWLTLIGLIATLALLALRLRGAILLGIVITTACAYALSAAGVVEGLHWPRAASDIVAVPTGWASTIGGFWLGFGELGRAVGQGQLAGVLTMLLIVLFMDMFDTVGTLVGVAHRGGLMRDGVLPRAERALAADAGATIAGAMMGTSTVTSYVESVTGVSAGARTGLAAIVTGVLMLAALLLQPLVQLITGGLAAGDGVARPMLAPALIVVGAMMMRTLRDIDWDDPTEYLPAFLTAAGMAFTYSIAHGIAIGLISYAAGKLLTGRARQCPKMVYVLAVLFIARYALMPTN